MPTRNAMLTMIMLKIKMLRMGCAGPLPIPSQCCSDVITRVRSISTSEGLGRDRRPLESKTVWEIACIVEERVYVVGTNGRWNLKNLGDCLHCRGENM